MIYFFDIDGVLADCTHRLHFLEEKDYDGFYSPDEMLNDKPIRKGIELYEDICSSPYSEVYLLTGRPEKTQETTKLWLERHGLIPAPMIMRRNHDWRPANVIKMEMLKKFLNEQQYTVPTILIDDDPNNIKKFEEEQFGTGILFGMKRIEELK